jgi:hypothetical protein
MLARSFLMPDGIPEAIARETAIAIVTDLDEFRRLLSLKSVAVHPSSPEELALVEGVVRKVANMAALVWLSLRVHTERRRLRGLADPPR